MFRIKSRKFTVHISAVLGIFALAQTASPTRAADPDIPGPNSFVRVLHAINGGPKVDVYIDGTRRLNDVTFNGLSKYMRVSTGYHTISIRTNNPQRVLLQGRRYFRNGDFYTLAAWNTPTRPRLLTFNDSGGSVRYNTARMTFYHLSPGAPRVSIVGITQAGGRTYRIINNLSYGQIKASYVPAVPMTLQIRAGGRTIKTLTGEEPRAGRKYAAYIMGAPGRNFLVNLDVTASQ